MFTSASSLGASGDSAPSPSKLQELLIQYGGGGIANIFTAEKSSDGELGKVVTRGRMRLRLAVNH